MAIHDSVHGEITRNYAKSRELTRNYGLIYNNKIQAFRSKQHMATKALIPFQTSK